MFRRFLLLMCLSIGLVACGNSESSISPADATAEASTTPTSMGVSVTQIRGHFEALANGGFTFVDAPPVSNLPHVTGTSKSGFDTMELVGTADALRSASMTITVLNENSDGGTHLADFLSQITPDWKDDGLKWLLDKVQKVTSSGETARIQHNNIRIQLEFSQQNNLLKLSFKGQ